MRAKSLVILCFLLVNTLHAQSPSDTINYRQFFLDVDQLIGQGNLDSALALTQRALQQYEAKPTGEQDIYAGLFQAAGVIYHYYGMYPEAKEKYDQALQIRKNYLGLYHVDMITSYLNLGGLASEFSKFEAALDLLDTAQLIIDRQTEPIPSLQANIFNNQGNTYAGMGQFRLAEDYYSRSLVIKDTLPGLLPNTRANAYVNLGTIFEEYGDFGKARDYYLIAKDILEKAYGTHIDLIQVHQNLGNVWFFQEQYHLAMTEFRKAEKIIRENFPEHPFMGQIYSNIANVQAERTELDTALYYDLQALDIWQRTFGDQPTIYSIITRIGLGNHLRLKKDWEASLRVYGEALHALQTMEGASIYTLANCYNHMGRVYSEQGDLPAALAHFTQAANTLSYDTLDLTLPIPWQASQDLEDALVNLGIAYNQRYRLTKDSNDLKKSGEFLTDAMIVKNGLRVNFADLTSKINLVQRNDLWSEWAVDTYQKLYLLTNDRHYLEAAFQFAEVGKSTLLFEAVRHKKEIQFEGVPDSLLQSEYDLKARLNYFYEKLIYSGSDESLSEDRARWNQEIFNLKRSYEELKADFANFHPGYFDLMYNLETVSLKQLQQSLPRDQAMIEYQVGDSTIFVFLVTTDEVRLIPIKYDFPLESWIEQVRKHITGTMPYNMDNFREPAHLLYQKLIRPLADELPERLVIVPDKKLGYIPFEALLTAMPKDNYVERWPFLINDHEISYNYSLTLLDAMKTIVHQDPSRQILAMAPFSGKDTVYLQLPNQSADTGQVIHKFLPLLYSKEEIDMFESEPQNQTVYGKAATKKKFMQEAPKCRILHLATHAEANSVQGENSFLVFAYTDQPDEQMLLHVRDLYGLQLNADLVVLSACETGIGELRQGEGIISLARAFSYAGAKSLITSLWKIDDQHTQQLMAGFYAYLNAGVSKDSSLRRAKLDYLKTHSGREAFPANWSGFVAIGDTSSIK
ncbi:CHAT domain-containing protein [Flavilitoribacter nigricans]|nr:CHAT domain-containing tetratricopeptide repeat protein [Flavilitoribacter nigricans]